MAFIAGASPASAAVTLRGIVPEDGPRLGWLERYTEARQGPEQIEKVTQTYKVGDAGALDLSHLAGDIRVTGGSGTEIKIDATKRAAIAIPSRPSGCSKRCGLTSTTSMAASKSARSIRGAARSATTSRPASTT